MRKIIFLFLVLYIVSIQSQTPSYFDLRYSLEYNAVSPVKDQQGGTCWTHAAMAVLESNLIMNQQWAQYENDEPNLAEYHLDWWNGFNLHYNADIQGLLQEGLEVHYGGDYRVTTAYLTRGEGAVRDLDGQSFETAPLQLYSNYHKYYPKEILWYTAGENLSNIETIKEQLMNHGAIGTAIYYHRDFLDDNYNFYQPASDENLPNHAVTIVGWDDFRETQAEQLGAWIVKNSWDTDWGENGYFWVSYYDKVAGQEPEMGAISMIDTQPMVWNQIYSWDFHGWRDTMTNVESVKNRFQINEKHRIKMIGFYTTDNDTEYSLNLYENNNLLYSYNGNAEFIGFHTHDIIENIEIENTDVEIELTTSNNQYAFDRSSEVPVLLGSSQRVFVPSYSERNQSFYKFNNNWIDIHDANFIEYPETANFCLKAYAEKVTTNPEAVEIELSQLENLDSFEVKWTHPKSDALERYDIFHNNELIEQTTRPFLDQVITLEDVSIGQNEIQINAVYNWNNEILEVPASSMFEFSLPQPEPFELEQISGTSVKLNWMLPNEHLKTKIYRNDEYIGQTFSSSFIDLNLDFGVYNYQISYAVENGESQLSVPQTITISEVPNTPINNITKFEKIYPNPFKIGERNLLKMNISIAQKDQFSFSLYDIRGRKIKETQQKLSAGSYAIGFPFSTPPSSGVYFVKMENSNYKSVKKILIIQ